MRRIGFALAATMVIAAGATALATRSAAAPMAATPLGEVQAQQLAPPSEAAPNQLETEPGYFENRATPPETLGLDPETGEALPGLIGNRLTLRALDKVTAETRDIVAPIGEDITFGSLTIRAHYCRQTPPEQPPETFALVEVFDRETDGAGKELEPRRIFSGWMFASNPALNPLEHGVFDVWPLNCSSSAAP
jgi:hypothetical protein